MKTQLEKNILLLFIFIIYIALFSDFPKMPITLGLYLDIEVFTNYIYQSDYFQVQG